MQRTMQLIERGEVVVVHRQQALEIDRVGDGDERERDHVRETRGRVVDGPARENAPSRERAHGHTWISFSGRDERAFPPHRALLEACRLVGDSVRARAVQRAIDARGLTSLGPVAFVALNDGDSQTFEEARSTTRTLWRTAPRLAELRRARA